MAKIRVATELLSDLLFGYSQFPVVIVGGRMSDHCVLELDISGPDVPDAPTVHAQFTVTQNRAGERFHTLKFEPVTEADWEVYEISRDTNSGGAIYGVRPKVVA